MSVCSPVCLYSTPRSLRLWPLDSCQFISPLSCSITSSSFLPLHTQLPYWAVRLDGGKWVWGGWDVWCVVGGWVSASVLWYLCVRMCVCVCVTWWYGGMLKLLKSLQNWLRYSETHGWPRPWDSWSLACGGLPLLAGLLWAGKMTYSMFQSSYM